MAVPTTPIGLSTLVTSIPLRSSPASSLIESVLPSHHSLDFYSKGSGAGISDICGEIQRRPDAEGFSGNSTSLILSAATAFGLGAAAFFSQEISPSVPASFHIGSEESIGLLLLALSLLTIMGLVFARSRNSSQKPDIDPSAKTPSQPLRHPTMKLRRTLRDLGSDKTCVPEYIPSLYEAETGPKALGIPPPPAPPPSEDLTLKQTAGAVRTAMPDEPTMGHEISAPVALIDDSNRPIPVDVETTKRLEEAAPRPAQMGNTERIIDASAVPQAVWQGNGTERLIEKTERLPVDAVTAASPPVFELTLDAPGWAVVSPHDEEKRKLQRDFLIQFRGPKGRSVIAEETLESAIRFLEKDHWSSRIQPDEVTLILSYLRLCRMIREPFDLNRELGMIRRSPESTAILLESELNELRELLKVEPSESNQAVIRYVLNQSKEDIRWLLDPINRALHLLCRKRTDIARQKNGTELLARYSFDILSFWKRFCQPL